MVLFEEPYLKIEFKNVPVRHLVSTWTGNIRSQQFKDGFQTVLRCCRENDIHKILTDIRRQEGVSSQDKRFVEQALKEYVKRHGMLFHAVIVPSDIFLEFSSESFERNNRQDGHLNQFFSNEKEAMQWLFQTES